MRIEVIRAWPRRHQAIQLDLAEGATVADALAASGFEQAEADGFAVFGERVSVEDALRDGDRLELLRPLQVDPKEARRRRASRPAR
jgi:uncharacterized protein